MIICVFFFMDVGFCGLTHVLNPGNDVQWILVKPHICQGNISIFIFDAMYLYICVSYHYIDSYKYFVKEFHFILFPFPYKTGS